METDFILKLQSPAQYAFHKFRIELFDGGCEKLRQLPANWAQASAMNALPLFATGHMIVVTPTKALVALDPAIGKRLWRFEPLDYAMLAQVNRGASCWIGPFR